jgi:protein SCO1
MDNAFSVRQWFEGQKGLAMRRFALCCLLVGAICTVPAPAQQPPPKVGIQEKLGQTLPLDVELYDETGQLVQLKSLVNKPTIFTFVYYRCPGICSPLLNELAKMVDKMDLVLGKDYQILTVSFDHREKPDIAAAKKVNYLDLVGKRTDPKGWRFLTADSMSIQRLTDAAGFYFMRSGNDYVHAGALIVVSPEAKITRYINGIKYLPFDVTMAVYEASTGKVGPTIATLLTICYSYDPEAHSYTLNVVRISGIVVLILVGIFVLIFLVRPKKKQAER